MASNSLFDRMFTQAGGPQATDEGLRAAKAYDAQDHQNEQPLSNFMMAEMQRADQEQVTHININNKIHTPAAQAAPQPAPIVQNAPVVASNDKQYGQDALIAQLEQASSDIDGESTETSGKTKNEAKDEALSRLVDDGPTPRRQSLTSRLLTTLAVVAVVGVAGYFGGAFLAANVPAIGAAVSGVGSAASGALASATGFLQGLGLISINAPVAGLAVGGGGSAIAIGGGIIGAIGATAIALKANVLQMVGIESSMNPAITGHEGSSQTIDTQDLQNGMDSVDISVADDAAAARNSSMQAKMGSKAAQYATKHDHYAVSRSGSSSWADRVGSKAAAHESYAQALEEARAMQADVAAEASR